MMKVVVVVFVVVVVAVVVVLVLDKQLLDVSMLHLASLLCHMSLFAPYLQTPCCGFLCRQKLFLFARPSQLEARGSTEGSSSHV